MNILVTKVHDWEIYKQLLDKEWNKSPWERDIEAIEILHAKYVTAFKRFEDKVWIECELPRIELLNKRANFG